MGTHIQVPSRNDGLAPPSFRSIPTSQSITGRPGCAQEVCFYCSLSEAKDPPELSLYERVEDLPKRPVGQSVDHCVMNRGDPAFFNEPMRVDPESVRALYLFIHKLVRRAPRGDHRLPYDGKPEKAQPIINASPLRHLDGIGCKDVEPELLRRDALEI